MGTQITCDDTNSCTADSCDAAKGCQYDPNFDGQGCDDSALRPTVEAEVSAQVHQGCGDDTGVIAPVQASEGAEEVDEQAAVLSGSHRDAL